MGLRDEPHSDDVKSPPRTRQHFPALGSLTELTPLYPRVKVTAGATSCSHAGLAHIHVRERGEKLARSALMPRTWQEFNVAKGGFLLCLVLFFSFKPQHHSSRNTLSCCCRTHPVTLLCCARALQQASAAMHRYLLFPANCKQPICSSSGLL